MHKPYDTHEYAQILVNPKSMCLIPHDSVKHQSFANEISRSLSQKDKQIHPKFFYNDKGSKLFEKICNLPEYYLSRTEIMILNQVRQELENYLKGDYRLVELGSGASIKTRKILDVLCKNQNQVEYFPIDISNIVKESSRELLETYDNLKITGIIDIYENGLKFIKSFDREKKLIAFLGSSLGNFNSESAKDFLKKIHESMNDDGFLLIGLDLIKDKKILESAYNDSDGVTADFNLNLLTRINDELGGNFSLSNFEHVAIYNENKNRIEMYLRSKVAQNVYISNIDLHLEFNKDELIHTENSYKYSIPQIQKLASEIGFKITKLWQDEKKYFVLALLSKI